MPRISNTTRLVSVIIACTIYFFVELAIGLKTRSLALIVDPFHQLNDLIAYIIALLAIRLSKKSKYRPGFTYALRRCEILGAFFNASILLALALSIFLQSIERFIQAPDIENPFWVVIVAAVGLVLNMICILVCHDHGHGHSHGHSHDSSHDRTHEHSHDHTHDHHGHGHTSTHQHRATEQHRHSHREAARDGGSDWEPSVEREIRAVRVPTIFETVARPISHWTHQSHEHPEGQAPQAHDRRSRSSTLARQTWWPSSFFAHSADSVQKEEKATSRSALDPGSPRGVLPDGQRWYEAPDPRYSHQQMPAALAAPTRTQAALASGNAAARHHHHSSQIVALPNGPAPANSLVHDHARDPTHDHVHTHHDHGHGHSHGNMNLAGVMLHLLGDFINNIGLLAAALVMWRSSSPQRFYADPACSLMIGLIIFFGSLPLMLRSARVLLQAAPKGVDLEHVEAELAKIPGVQAVRCLHIWQLTENDIIGSLEIDSTSKDLVSWSLIEQQIRRQLSQYGVGHLTISPQFVKRDSSGGGSGVEKCEMFSPPPSRAS